jgi:biopolymer transport protein ExbD
MAGGQSDPEDDLISGINVTPLVDIVLVLLIIFMVTASHIVRPAIPLDLPKAQTSEPVSTGLLAVAVAKDGKIYLNGKPGSLDEINAAVQRARAAADRQSQKLEAFVSADRRAPYGLFAAVVDRLRIAGVVDIAMDTKPGDLETPEEAPEEAPEQ